MKTANLQFKDLSTQRLELKKLTCDNAEDFHRITIKIFDSLNLQTPANLEDTRNWIKNLKYKEMLIWAVFLKESNKFVGWINANIDNNRNYKRAELGYIFDPKYHNLGYGIESMRKLLEHVFESEVESVIFIIREDNQRSSKLAKKLGAKLQWIQKNDVFKDGRYYDMHAYILEK